MVARPRVGLRSQLDDIEAELAEYDAFSQGQVTELEAESIVALATHRSRRALCAT